MRRQSALNIILEVLREHRTERLSFNELCLAVDKYCKDNSVREPSFSTILAKLQRETGGCKRGVSRIKWEKDGRIMRYYLGAPEDNKSAKLATWIPEEVKQ